MFLISFFCLDCSGSGTITSTLKAASLRWRNGFRGTSTRWPSSSSSSLCCRYLTEPHNGTSPSFAVIIDVSGAQTPKTSKTMINSKRNSLISVWDTEQRYTSCRGPSQQSGNNRGKHLQVLIKWLHSCDLSNSFVVYEHCVYLFRCPCRCLFYLKIFVIFRWHKKCPSRLQNSL